MTEENRLPGLPLSEARKDDLHANNGIKRDYLDRDDVLIRETEMELDLPVYLRGHPGIVDPRGIVFGWRATLDATSDTNVTYQLRPDNPTDDEDGRPRKYIWPTGRKIRFGILSDAGPGSPVVIVEGTRQGHCVASYLGAEWTVLSIAGVASWSGGESAKWQAPKEMIRLCVRRSVFILTDGDAADNLNVYNAADQLGKAVRPVAKEVFYLPPPGSGTMGIDDLIAMIESDEDREATIRAMLDRPQAKPAPRKPAPKKSASKNDDEDDETDRLAPGRRDAVDRAMAAFAAGTHVADEDGNRVIMPGKLWMRPGTSTLAVASMGSTIMESGMPVASTKSGAIGIYKPSGVYDATPKALGGVMGMLLGDYYNTSAETTLQAYLDRTCMVEGKVLPVGQSGYPLVNFTNGMLDLNSESDELIPHDPKYKSTRQLPFPYDPNAECPTYDKWIESVAGKAQVPIVEEAISQFLDESRAPTRAVFLFGKSRSGKSTLIWLAGQMVGPDLRTNISMHALATDKFAPADMYGMAICESADMSAKHVSDTSLFKQVLGEDLIHGDKKYGERFSFYNTAMMVMSANKIPTISKDSNAVDNRLVPISFPKTFENHEDKTLKDRLKSELPGIARRWVEARRAHIGRGEWLSPVPEVAQFFGQSSDRVARFVATCCIVDGPDTRLGAGLNVEQGSSKDNTWTVNRHVGVQDLHNAFSQWCEDESAPDMGRSAFRDRLSIVPGVRKIPDPMRTDRLIYNVSIKPRDAWTDSTRVEDYDDLERVLFPDEAKHDPKPTTTTAPSPPPENVTPITKAPRFGSDPAPAPTQPRTRRKRYW